MTIEEYAATLAKEFGSTKANKESAIYRACIKMGIAVQDKTIDKACEWLYEWNKKQALVWENAERPRINDYTMNVSEFRKAMEDKV